MFKKIRRNFEGEVVILPTLPSKGKYNSSLEERKYEMFLKNHKEREKEFRSVIVDERKETN